MLARQNQSADLYTSSMEAPKFAGGHTLEEFVERALIQVFTSCNTDRAMEALTTPRVAEHIFDQILRSVVEADTTKLRDGSKDEVDETGIAVINMGVDDILMEYDGHDRHHMLYHKLCSLLKDIPIQETIDVIRRRKPDFIAKIRVLIAMILNRKKDHSQRGVVGFLNTHYRGEIPKSEYYQSATIELTLAKLGNKVRLVLLNEGERFRAYRVAIDDSGDTEIPLKYTGLVVKVMNRIGQTERSQRAIYETSMREHKMVSEMLSGNCVEVPHTWFRDTDYGLPSGLPEEMSNRYIAYQNHVTGVPLWQAEGDNFLQRSLNRSLTEYYRLARKMREQEKRILSSPDKDILVRRCVRDTHERLILQIVNTTGLITV